MEGLDLVEERMLEGEHVVGERREKGKEKGRKGKRRERGRKGRRKDIGRNEL